MYVLKSKHSPINQHLIAIPEFIVLLKLKAFHLDYMLINVIIYYIYYMNYLKHFIWRLRPEL